MSGGVEVGGWGWVDVGGVCVASSWDGDLRG